MSKMDLTTLKAGGELTENHLLKQLQADLPGVQVIRATVKKTTAPGVAFAAKMAVGIRKDAAEFQQTWSADRVWRPNAASDAPTRLYFGWKKVMTRTLEWSGSAHSTLQPNKILEIQ